ncbi:1-acyl-sn-glycerol-3-phosphate acyltransferase [bacterium]|nr:1-acyl-sn-glycerol-3-phosphate acyltransferase [bacterium]
MNTLEDKFHDIRPFTDSEFIETKKRLIKNGLLISSIRLMMWPKIPRSLIGLFEVLIQIFLKIRLFNISTVDDFQKKIIGNRMLKWVLDHSTDSLTFTGLENLDVNETYMFISNHRDIVLDSALIDYILHINGHKVPYIAFGDNLLFNEMVEDLIRINKAFIVKRNLPRKQQLKELKHLSEYINLILKNGNHIWIAQKEGRAKDGIDRTNPAIIKMFHLSERKNQPDFSAFIKSLNIVPVSVSYEKDPCDRIKARELFQLTRKGEFKKRKKYDLVSMAAGISRDKGHIHVAFSKPLKGSYETEKEVAMAIDNAIQESYRLWPRNYIAYDELMKVKTYSSHYSDLEKQIFLSQYKNLNPGVREILLQSYANPIKSKESILESNQ